MDKYTDLVQSLNELRSGDKGITIIYSLYKEEYISYDELWTRSIKLCKLLNKKGIGRKNEIVIQCKNIVNMIISFWSCIIGGYIAIPMDASNNEFESGKNEELYQKIKDPYLLYDNIDNFYSDSISFKHRKQKSLNLNYINYDYLEYDESVIIIAKAEDIAYIQFSSGTAGISKGVIVKRKNILSNIYSTCLHNQVTKSERFLSWFPLTHCFGIIYYHITPIVLGVAQ